MAVNKSYLVKGVIYAVLLAAGLAVGAFMKALNADFFFIWAIVAVINTLATIVVFSALKKDLSQAEEVPDDEGKGKKSPSKAEANKAKND